MYRELPSICKGKMLTCFHCCCVIFFIIKDFRKYWNWLLSGQLKYKAQEPPYLKTEQVRGVVTMMLSPSGEHSPSPFLSHYILCKLTFIISSVSRCSSKPHDLSCHNVPCKSTSQILTLLLFSEFPSYVPFLGPQGVNRAQSNCRYTLGRPAVCVFLYG